MTGRRGGAGGRIRAEARKRTGTVINFNSREWAWPRSYIMYIIPIRIADWDTTQIDVSVLSWLDVFRRSVIVTYRWPACHVDSSLPAATTAQWYTTLYFRLSYAIFKILKLQIFFSNLHVYTILKPNENFKSIKWSSNDLQDTILWT